MSQYLKSLFIMIMLTIASITSTAFATTQGMVLVVKGNAQLLDNSQKLGKTLSYRGRKFYYKKLRLGQRVQPGQFIKCDPGCNVKVGFANGDSIFIGPGTTMEVPKLSHVGNEKDINQLELFYGKIRAIISPKGPRKNLKIRSRSAVTGVRGTDLFVSYNDYAGHHTSVILGEVQVSPVIEKTDAKSKAQAKPKVIKSGEVANIKPDTQIVESRKINRAELKDIQKMAEVKLDKKALRELPTKSQADIAQFEKQANTVIIEDIRKHSPEIIKALPKEVPITADVLNEITIANLYDQAPEGKIEWEQKPKIEKPHEITKTKTPHWANKLEMTLVFNRYEYQGPQLPGGKSFGARAAWNPRIFTLGTHWVGEGLLGLTPTTGTIFDHAGGDNNTFYTKTETLAVDFGFRFKYQASWFFTSLGLIGSSTNVKFGGMELQLGLPTQVLPNLDSIAIGLGGLDWNSKQDGKGLTNFETKDDLIKLNFLTLNSFWRF